MIWASIRYFSGVKQFDRHNPHTGLATALYGHTSIRSPACRNSKTKSAQMPDAVWR
jgi:hypothetical protein